IVGERDLPHMDPEDSFTASVVGARHDNATVEAARPQQRGVEHVWPVGRSHQDYTLVGLEPIHLDQQLVERLFAFVMAAAQASPAMPSDGVDLIDEDDTGGVLF